MNKLFFPKRYQDISKHRQFIYGFAALWIAFFHMVTKVPGEGIFVPLRFVQGNGTCGVDIFLLMTGMGLYHSLKKDPNLCHFYTRRLLRVFLPSFIVIAVFQAFSSQHVFGYAASITFLNYWLGGYTYWYVAFILTMYLLYPLLFKLQKKHPKALFAMILPAIVFSFAVDAFPQVFRTLDMRAISRIPVFLLGCAIAPNVAGNEKIPGWVFPLAAAVSVASLPFTNRMYNSEYYYAFRGLFYIAYAVTVLFIVSAAAEGLSRLWKGAAYRVFAFFGLFSLEIYLLFERMQAFISRWCDFDAIRFGLLKKDLIAMIFTILASIALRHLCNAIEHSFRSIRIPERSRCD